MTEVPSDRLLGDPRAAHATRLRVDRIFRPVLACAAVFVALVLLHRGLFTGPVSPVIHGDEAAYLGNARWIVDGHGRAVRGYYSGYSLFLAPVALLARDPERFYRLALVVNVLLSVVSAGLAYALVRRVFSHSERWIALAAAACVILYPFSFVFVGIAMSENALIPATFACAVALSYAVRSRRVAHFAGAAVLAAFPNWVTPRGLLISAAFVFAVGVDWRRMRTPLPTIAAVSGALVVTLAAGHVFNDAVKGSGRVAGVTDRESGPLEALLPQHWPDWVAGIAGRSVYLGAASAGLFLVGVVVGVGWMRTHGIGPAAAVRRAVGAFCAAAIVFTVVADSAAHATKGVLPRLDYLYYGRYAEGVGLPALAIGVAWFLSARSRPRLWAAAVGVPPALVALLLVVFALEPQRPGETTANLVNLVVLVPIQQFSGVTTVATALLVGSVVALALLSTRLIGRRVAAVALVVSFLVTAVSAHDVVVVNAVRDRSEQRVLVSFVARLADMGVPSDCILVERSPEHSVWHEVNYRVFLPRSRFVPTTSPDASACGPLVVSSDYAVAVEASRLAFVAGENHAALALWLDRSKIPAATSARLVDYGLIFPGTPCELLPSSAYASSIVSSVELRRGRILDLRLSVSHTGSGAPWLATSTLAVPDGCGRVAIVVALLGPTDDVLRAERVGIPRTMVPGESATVRHRVEVPGRYADDGFDLEEIASIRIALVQDGVTWFADAGGREERLERGVDW